MQLLRLLRALGLESPVPEVEVTRVTDDSRQVISGALFVAYPGVNVDGARFIPDAIRRGASAIVTQTHDSAFLRSGIPTFVVPDGRAALAQLSAAYFDYPSRNLRVIGVTGTDGKTTTSTLIENILLAAGHTVGTITTVAAHIGGQAVDTGFHTTTPDAPAIQHYLAEMVAQGTEYAVIESTSHGFAQRRLDAIDFDTAVVTNITHEHLDMHGSWENYRDAKAMLFRALSTTHKKPRTAKVAVLNADDNTRGVFDFLRAFPSDEKVIYTTNEHRRTMNTGEIWIAARDISHTPDGLEFAVDTPFGELIIKSPLIGRYNVSNILAAAGAAVGRRIPFGSIALGVHMTREISGRMERIENTRDLTVIVDFAHTPYALENALQTARELARSGSSRPYGRVICVFGCAGLRDVQKRAWMGEIAGRLAEVTIVTAEDPRTEPLAQINAQIAEGLHKVGRIRDRDFFIVDDRARAIDFAINTVAGPGDIVMLCGKGHERSMCFGTTEYPWSDREAAREALARKGEG